MAPFQSEYRLMPNALAECIARFDPLAAAVEIVHRHGMKILPWITLADSYWPGNEDPFFARHPQLLLMDRQGRCVERGVPCYACPEVRQYRLAEAREVMEQYDCDGIYYSAHSHNDCTRVDGDIAGKNAYGYNPSIAEAYQARHGVDPRAQEVDVESLAAFRGEFLWQFLQETCAAVRRRGGELIFNAELSGPGEVGGGLHVGPRGEYHITPLGKLFDVGDHFVFSLAPEELDAALDAKLAALPADKTYHASVHVGFSRSSAEEAIAAWRPALQALSCRKGIAGIHFHEAMAFEFDCPELWNFAEACAAL